MATLNLAVPGASQASGSTYDPSGLIGDIMNAESTAGAPAATPAATPAPSAPRALASDAIVEAAAPAESLEGVPDSLLPEGLFEAPDKPAAPAAEVADEPEPPEVAAGGTKARNAFAQVRGENKTLKAKLKELEAKVSDAQNSQKPPEMQKLLELQQQVQQYEDRLGQLDITQTKAFKMRYEIPAESTFNRGASLIQKHGGVSQDDAKRIMQQLVDSAGDASAMQDLIADQPVPVQGALYNLVSDYEQLSKDKADALANWKQTKLALDENANRDTDVQLAQNIEKDTAAAIQRAQGEGNWMYNTTGGKNAEWDAAVQKRVDTVKGILRTATNEELVKWVVEGLTAKDLRTIAATERKRSDGLLAQLQQRTGMRPGLGGRTPPATPGAKPTGPQSPDSVLGTMFG